MSSRARGRQPQPLASSGTPSKEIGKRDLLAWAATVSGQRIETMDDLRDGVVLALIFTDTFPAVVGREQVLSRALTLTLILTLQHSVAAASRRRLDQRLCLGICSVALLLGRGIQAGSPAQHYCRSSLQGREGGVSGRFAATQSELRACAAVSACLRSWYYE